MSIIGTRPEIIRLSRIFPKLDEKLTHIIVHTGQNYHPKLSEIFFEELDLRQPDYYLGASIPLQTFGEQIAEILIKTEELLLKLEPDYVLILGDVNSCLSAIVAERLQIPVVHMEAGNRCYDLKVPEEINRRIIDHTVSWNLPYTQKSKDNLLREGIPNERIFLCGNPIKEVITANEKQIRKSKILDKLDIKPKEFFIATSHRQENVDNKIRLGNIVKGFTDLSSRFELPIIWSVHPRTKNKLNEFKIVVDNELIEVYEPFGLFDFLKLEKNALGSITDSGTVQEECCLFKVPTVTIRDSTERPETVECGSNFISGVKPETIVKGMEFMLQSTRDWEIPEGYNLTNVSDRVTNFILGLMRFM
ncbi:MAG: non-hydrolyzing UDP-N-acetylglucosamine 2-epimerase [Candidatus Thorarchaeota archaeon]